MKRIAVFLIFYTSSCILLAQAPVTPKAAATGQPKNTSALTAVLGAFGDELKILESQVQQKTVSTIQGIPFTQGTLNGRKVVIALTGIGKVNAAIVTTLVLDHFRPEEVVFTGIAGGINPDLSPGDIVIGTMIAHHDYGTLTPDSMLLRPTRNPSSMIENPIYFPSDSVLVALAERAAKNATFEIIPRINAAIKPTVTKGAIVTGDVFVSSVAATQTLRKKMNAEATEMEGAAVAQACWQQHVPFIVIRSLSDNAGNNAYNDVRKFYQVASHNSASLVISLLGLIAETP